MADVEPPASYERRKCRWCGARMLMARMPSGKDNPLDYEPNPEKGNVVLDGHGKGYALTKVEVERLRAGPTLMDPNVPAIDRYLSHWASCPEAPKHRSPRTSGTRSRRTPA
jgi:hypothetical protein